MEYEKTNKLIDKEIRLVVDRGSWGGGWAKWEKVVERYKFPVIRQVSSGNVMYSMVTKVNHTVLQI